VDNKLAIDAVFGKNMEAFRESDGEDESCGSGGDTEDGDSDDGSDANGGLESNNGDDVSASVIARGYTEEDDLNEEDLAISEDKSDLHGDASASFSFASLMNALPDPLDDDDEVLNDPVTLASVVTLKSLDINWFNTHSVGDLRRPFISFLTRGACH
jgi:hypothetical protein